MYYLHTYVHTVHTSIYLPCVTTLSIFPVNKLDTMFRIGYLWPSNGPVDLLTNSLFSQCVTELVPIVCITKI